MRQCKIIRISNSSGPRAMLEYLS